MTQPVPARVLRTVADILSSKGDQVHVTDANAPVRSAVQTMVDANVGALVVFEAETIVGMLTERDYFRRIVLQPHMNRDVPVGQVMSAPVIFVSPETSIDDCMALMTKCRIRHAPVLDDKSLVGIVSIGDLVKARMTQHEVQIQYLHDYIMAR